MLKQVYKLLIQLCPKAFPSKCESNGPGPCGFPIQVQWARARAHWANDPKQEWARAQWANGPEWDWANPHPTPKPPFLPFFIQKHDVLFLQKHNVLQEHNVSVLQQPTTQPTHIYIYIYIHTYIYIYVYIYMYIYIYIQAKSLDAMCVSRLRNGRPATRPGQRASL